jgi:hypothetical protein
MERKGKEARTIGQYISNKGIAHVPICIVVRYVYSTTSLDLLLHIAIPNQ